MTSLTNEFANMKKASLQTTKVKLDQRRDELSRLEEAIKQFPQEVQAKYRKNLVQGFFVAESKPLTGGRNQ